MRPHHLLSLLALAAASLTLTSCGDKLDPVCDGSTPVYDIEVKPLITSNCALSGCHAAGSPDGDFTTYAGISAKTSTGQFSDEVFTKQTMPRNDKLTQSEINIFKCWAENGFKEK